MAEAAVAERLKCIKAWIETRAPRKYWADEGWADENWSVSATVGVTHETGQTKTGGEKTGRGGAPPSRSALTTIRRTSPFEIMAIPIRLKRRLLEATVRFFGSDTRHATHQKPAQNTVTKTPQPGQD